MAENPLLSYGHSRYSFLSSTVVIVVESEDVVRGMIDLDEVYIVVTSDIIIMEHNSELA
jgi:hypothetical protein